MKAYISKVAILAVVIGVLSACSTSDIYHKNLMAGQVVGADGSQVVVCIGSEGAVEEGLTFNVFRINDQGGITADDFRYSRTFAGTIEITKIIDGHFARANVMSGKVQRNDMIELKTK